MIEIGIFLLAFLYQPYNYSSINLPLLEFRLVQMTRNWYHHCQIHLFLYIFGALTAATKMLWLYNLSAGLIQFSYLNLPINIQDKGISYQTQFSMHAPIFCHIKFLTSHQFYYGNKPSINHYISLRSNLPYS